MKQKKEYKEFTDKAGEYGYMWGGKFKKNRDAFPTFNEMMEGVFKWFTDQAKKEMHGKS